MNPTLGHLINWENIFITKSKSSKRSVFKKMCNIFQGQQVALETKFQHRGSLYLAFKNISAQKVT